MDAKLSPPSASRRRPWAVRPWTLVVFGLLLLAGTLIQACSDNNGSTGPTFECREAKASGSKKALAQCTASPAPTTGFSNTSAEIRVQVAINPNTITPGRRAGITAIVTNLNGQPLAGKNVNFTTDVGTLDNNEGITNKEGKSSTTLSITPTDVVNAQGKTSATVTAFVEGAFGTGVVNFGPTSTLVIIPSTVTQTLVATSGGTCTVALQFVASGGVPPYTFSAGIPGNMSAGGAYAAAGIATGTILTDTATVTDAAAATASAPISITCNEPSP